MTDVRNASVARRDEQQKKQIVVARFIERLGPQVARALPVHLNADRMTRLALTAVRTTPALADCSETSMAGAILTAAALGLEPNTPTGECYLVPYSGEVQFQLGYQGMIKLFWQHPLAAQLECEAVYEADDFDYQKGSGAFLRHKPNKHAADRGKITDYYAFAKLKTGAEAFEVLTPDEIKQLRQGKVGPDARFKGGDPMHWMERKTVLRQLFKLLPKDTNLQRGIDADDQESGTSLYRARAAERADLVPERPALTGPVDTATGEVFDGQIPVGADQ